MEAALVAALAPFLPYLLRAGERAGQEVAEALGGAAGDLAKSLWAKLRPGVESRPAAREAVADAAAQPEDERVRHALELQLEKVLRDDPALAEELGRMLQDAERRGIVVTGGGVVVTGDQHVGEGGIVAGRDVTISGP